MAELYELHQRPELHEPAFVMGLEGWIDAGFGEAGAVVRLLEAMTTTTIATFDGDRLIDYRSRRPVMHLVDGRNTGLTWAGTELRHGRDAAGRDVLLLLGSEPDFEWNGFADAVVDLARGLGVTLVTGLGAYPAPVPHTRPVRVVSTATTDELAAQVGFIPGAIDVPAGAHAAVEARCAEVGVPAVGLWAQVPHYAAAMPYPAASAALIETLSRTAGIAVDPGELPSQAEAARLRLEGLIANSEEHQALVRQLETQFDTELAGRAEELPSGDQIAAELQRFLRDQQ